MSNLISLKRKEQFYVLDKYFYGYLNALVNSTVFSIAIPEKDEVVLPDMVFY